MITYQPQPGTIPARVVAHFEQLPPGTELSTIVLADTLGCDRSGFASCLEYAHKHGALAREKRDGLVYWRRGAGAAPAPVIDPEEADADPFVHRVVPTSAPAPAVVKQITPRGSKAASAPVKPAAGEGHAERRPEPQGLRLAIWSDGQLVIERGIERHEFSVDETKAIVHYLERLAEAE